MTEIKAVRERQGGKCNRGKYPPPAWTIENRGIAQVGRDATKHVRSIGEERLEEIYFQTFVSAIQSTIYEAWRTPRRKRNRKAIYGPKRRDEARETLKRREGWDEIKKYILPGAQFHSSNDRSFAYIIILERER